MDLTCRKVRLEFVPKFFAPEFINIEAFVFKTQDNLLLPVNRETRIDEQACITVLVEF